MKSEHRKHTWFCLSTFIWFLLAASANFATEAQYFDCGTSADSIGNVADPLTGR